MEVVGDSIEGVEVLVEAHRQGLTRRSPKGEAHAETINGACIDMIWRSKDHHGAVCLASGHQMMLIRRALSSIPRSGFGCGKENFSIFGSYFLPQNLYLDPIPDRNLGKKCPTPTP